MMHVKTACLEPHPDAKVGNILGLRIVAPPTGIVVVIPIYNRERHCPCCCVVIKSRNWADVVTRDLAEFTCFNTIPWVPACDKKHCQQRSGCEEISLCLPSSSTSLNWSSSGYHTFVLFSLLAEWEEQPYDTIFEVKIFIESILEMVLEWKIIGKLLMHNQA